MRTLSAFCLVGVFAAGCDCGGGATSGSGLAITVKFENSSATCVAAGVELDGTGTVFRSAPAIGRGTKATLVFGVERTSLIKGKVIPFARGYKASDCSSVDFAVFDESAIGSVVDLDQPGVQTVTLTLTGGTPGDGGKDGGLDAGDGGLDAGDGGLDAGDAGCIPAALEDCLDGKDNTCDGLIDCADPGCNAKPCVGGGTCGIQSDGGRSCIQAIETLCNDLTDNDGDGKIDCADPDCAGKPCNDGNACTSADFCNPFSVPDGGGYCDGGAPTTCTNALLNCRATSGACLSATGACSFAPLDGGQRCDDGVPCTHTDRCNTSAVCSGVTYSCASTQCIDAGTCLGDGGCAFVYASPTTACDDQASCTYTDLCDGVGVCTGTGYSCAAPPPCFSGSACLGDGGCAWTFNGVDSGCPGGTCGSDAGCVPFTNGFGYPTSNFDPTSIPDASIAPATIFSACTVEFDSTTNTFVDGGWCSQVKPTPFVFSQAGGISTTVLAMAGLKLAPNATLIFYGTRPVILAVYGSVNIQGVIDARSVDTARIGPGGDYGGCGAMDGQSASQSAGGGGAGFGTAGRPGAGPGAGAAGIASANLTLEPLHGGCRGGQGHDNSNRTNAMGGSGGGAIQISAASTLAVSGTISASGAGGLGGATGLANDVGGGGAGSGGGIFLEADQLDLTASARLICNGGGGGGGRKDGSGVTGQPGQSGTLNSVVVALGGQGGTPPAGDGGSGAAGLTPPGNAVAGAGTAGSGGGGAGLGVIRLNGVAGCTNAGAVVSGSLTKSPACP